MNRSTQNIATSNGPIGSGIPRFRPKSPAAAPVPPVRGLKSAPTFLRTQVSASNNNLETISNSNISSNNNNNNHHSQCFKSGVYKGKNTQNLIKMTAVPRTLIKPSAINKTTVTSSVTRATTPGLPAGRPTIKPVNNITVKPSPRPTTPVSGMLMDMSTYESFNSDLVDIKKLLQQLVGELAKKEPSPSVNAKSDKTDDADETLLASITNGGIAEIAVTTLQLENNSLRKRVADLEKHLSKLSIN